MYCGISLRTIGVVAACVALFLSGSLINGWRWESKLQAQQVIYANRVIAAQEAARAQQLKIEAAVDAERKVKDEHIKTITAQLNDALVELRKRPSRSTASPNASCSPTAATGAQLSREDSEFLAREAARADSVMTELRFCHSAYEEARKSINQLNGEKR